MRVTSSYPWMKRRQIEVSAADQWLPARALGDDGQLHVLSNAYMRPTAQVATNAADFPILLIEFTDEGARMMTEVSTRNLNRPLGVFVDSQLATAPTVAAVISAGAVLEGLSPEAVQTLADRINDQAARAVNGCIRSA